ncbi:MAG TPA: LysR family transcriptional regulator, partial [Halieaceae bacterium]|nr:LysR family transcriptional regulator [Halieaceae bacterium]
MKGAEYAQLEAFLAVAERCNFRRAAAHLGLA